MLKQCQPQATPLVFRLDRNVEQVRLVEDDLHHTVADLLLTFEHQPDLILAQAIEENPAGPGMAIGRIFDFQYSFQVRLGHRAKRYSVTHSILSSAPSADAWLARHQPYAVALPLIIPGPATPRPSPGLRSAIRD
ncbi:hypothetical protein D3C71_1545550 [compost metagenome]